MVSLSLSLSIDRMTNHCWKTTNCGRYGLSDEVKIAFVRKLKEDLCCKDWRAFKAGLKAFCGGKKKGTGGTPPVHAAYANRQQQQRQQQQQVLVQVRLGWEAKAKLIH